MISYVQELPWVLSMYLLVFTFRGDRASVACIVPYAALHYMAYEEYQRWINLGIPSIRTSPVLDLVACSFAGAS